jgi:hypothetical protein
MFNQGRPREIVAAGRKHQEAGSWIDNDIDKILETRSADRVREHALQPCTAAAQIGIGTERQRHVDGHKLRWANMGHA